MAYRSNISSSYHHHQNSALLAPVETAEHRPPLLTINNNILINSGNKANGWRKWAKEKSKQERQQQYEVPKVGGKWSASSKRYRERIKAERLSREQELAAENAALKAFVAKLKDTIFKLESRISNCESPQVQGFNCKKELQRAMP